MVNKTALIVGSAVVGLAFLGAGGFYASTHTGFGVKAGAYEYSGLTEQQIKEKISNDVLASKVVIEANGKTVEGKLSDLGVEVTNSEDLATKIINETVFWKIGNWNSNVAVSPEVSIDPVEQQKFILDNDLGAAPINASIIFSETQYVVQPGTPGLEANIDNLSEYVNALFSQNAKRNISLTETAPAITDEIASAKVDWLNGKLANAGYDIAGENYKPEWGEVFIVEANGNDFKVTLDSSKTSEIVSGLPDVVNREAIVRDTITDSQGNVLKVLKDGHSGRKLLDDSASLKDKTEKELLAEVNTPIALNVDVVEVADNAKARRIEVDISEQRLYLFENEVKVADWAVSTGAQATPTDLGQFKTRAFLRSQTMRGDDYIQPDVPWVIYYNGDEAIHGAYWHNQFGTRRSHGCVNLPVDQAKLVYEFAYVGMDVWVHD